MALTDLHSRIATVFASMCFDMDRIALLRAHLHLIAFGNWCFQDDG